MQFIIKACVMDDERIKAGGSALTDQYIEEQLQRVREISSISERKFYLEIKGVYATAIDYDVTAQAKSVSLPPCRTSCTGRSSDVRRPEVVCHRPNAHQPHMRLNSWKEAPAGKIQKLDVVVAKSYLTEPQMAQLSRLVNAYLDVAEDMAQRKIPMTTQDWETRLNRFIAVTDREVLQDAGKVRLEIAKAHAESDFEKYRILQDRLFERDFDRLLKGIESGNPLDDDKDLGDGHQ